MKRQFGKDMAPLDSDRIMLQFIQHGLNDEYRIIVNPVVIDNVNPLFKGIKEWLNLPRMDLREGERSALPALPSARRKGEIK